MLREGHIHEFGNFLSQGTGSNPGDIAVNRLTEAFLSSEDYQQFRAAIETFIEQIIKHHRFHARDGANTIEEFILHLAPAHLLKRLPLITPRTRIQNFDNRGNLEVTCLDPAGNAHHAVVPYEELAAAFREARRHVQQRLREQGLEYAHIANAGYAREGSSNRTLELHDGKVFKPGHEDIQAAERAAALDRLYSLNERSPYLAYPASTVPPRGGIRTSDRALRTKLDLRTLEQRVKEDGFDFADGLSAVADALRGVGFLDAHGLALTDLDPSNIGIDAMTGRGVLFDYGGLGPKDKKMWYIGKPDFIPPEGWQNGEIGSSPDYTNTGLAQAVYELGQTLAFLNRHWSERRLARPEEASVIAELDRLIEWMLNNLPAERPSAHACLEAIDLLVRWLDGRRNRTEQDGAE